MTISIWAVTMVTILVRGPTGTIVATLGVRGRSGPAELGQARPKFWSMCQRQKSGETQSGGIKKTEA
jgi:hypothetical protein